MNKKVFYTEKNEIIKSHIQSVTEIESLSAKVYQLLQSGCL